MRQYAPPWRGTAAWRQHMAKEANGGSTSPCSHVGPYPSKLTQPAHWSTHAPKPSPTPRRSKCDPSHKHPPDDYSEWKALTNLGAMSGSSACLVPDQGQTHCIYLQFLNKSILPTLHYWVELDMQYAWDSPFVSIFWPFYTIIQTP